MQKLSISIIIVTWNGRHHLEQFLPSVVESADDHTEILIADNDSTDGTKDLIHHSFPSCRVIEHDDNYGYCGGNNRAVPYATGDILIFLNNDVEVEPNWLKGIRSMMEAQPEVAALQPKMLSYSNPESFEYAGAAGGWIDKYGFPFCKGRIFDTLEDDNGQYDKSDSIFWASGAALAIRKDLFEDLGGFDEHFEFHMEEIDLCWRVQRAGYNISYQPESIVYHLGGGSLPTNSPRKTYYNFRNNLIMMHKNMTEDDIGKVLKKKLWLDRIASIKMLISGQLRQFWAVRKAHKDAFAYLKSDRFQIDNTIPRQPLSELHGVYHHSLVWDYFVRGITRFTKLNVEEDR